MIFYIALFVLGLLLVLKGGDLFVDSSISIAERLKIPRMIIGGTIVRAGGYNGGESAKHSVD
jgi:cation:H+ antiporter